MDILRGFGLDENTKINERITGKKMIDIPEA